MAAEVFISYAHKDREQVVAWVQRLQAAGASVWIDERGIEGATRWEEEIVEAIIDCTVVLLMLSTASAASPHVAREVALALDEKKVILPVTLEPITLPATLRYALAGIQRIDLATGEATAKLDAVCRALTLSGVNLTPTAAEPTTTSVAAPRTHNLPNPLTSFVGREKEIAEVRELLAAGNAPARSANGALPGTAATPCEARLVTLTGPGGSGKTRLAIAVASSILDEFPEGVFMVELHTLTSPELVLPTVATALGVREQPGRPLHETLIQHLRPRSLLLVLDNCEHVVGACAELAHVLLGACPRLEILATSQEPLGLAGETVWPIPALSLPDSGVQSFRTSGIQERPDSPSIGSPNARTQEGPNAFPLEHPILAFEAAQLFVDRARAVQPDFEVGEEEAAGIGQICRQLDGIPLAIELAAARVKLLSVEQIAARLEDRFRLLTRGDRTAPRRQQTLLEALNWSHDLLSEPERTLLRRLSVFAGGWSMEAAESVCSGIQAFGRSGVQEGPDSLPAGHPNARTPERLNALSPEDVLDLLGRLVDRSLVVAEEREGEGRYRMLQTIRQYGALQLAAAGEAAELRSRHAEWYRRLAEEGESALRGPKQGIWLARLELEHANMRSALLGAAEDGDVETALRLAGALGRFWLMRGYVAEGRERSAAALAAAHNARTLHRGKVLHGAGVLAIQQGDYPAAGAVLGESLALYRELGDRPGIAEALDALGILALERGDCAAARGHLDESRALREQLGDRGGLAATLGNLALVAQEEGDYATARELHKAGLAIERELGDQWGMAASLDNLGLVDTEEGNYAAARTHHEQSLALREELGDKGGIASTLDNMGYLSRCQGDCGRAAALYAESLAMARELGDKDAMTESLGALAVVAAMQHQSERAARLFGAVEAFLAHIDAPLPFAERDDYERAVEAVRASLGEAAFDAARVAGQIMTTEQALAYALETESSD